MENKKISTRFGVVTATLVVLARLISKGSARRVFDVDVVEASLSYAFANKESINWQAVNKATYNPQELLEAFELTEKSLENGRRTSFDLTPVAQTELQRLRHEIAVGLALERENRVGAIKFALAVYIAGNTPDDRLKNNLKHFFD